MHDKIVPLRERLEEAHQRSALVLAREGKKRCPKTEEVVDARIFELEAEIFDAIVLSPDDVTEELIARSSGDARQRST